MMNNKWANWFFADYFAFIHFVHMLILIIVQRNMSFITSFFFFFFFFVLCMQVYIIQQCLALSFPFFLHYFNKVVALAKIFFIVISFVIYNNGCPHFIGSIIHELQEQYRNRLPFQYLYTTEIQSHMN